MIAILYVSMANGKTPVRDITPGVFMAALKVLNKIR